MKFYRGPEGKSLEDPSYECVGEYDFSENTEAWTWSTTIRINIAKDKGAEKQSAIYVEIDEADVLILHQTLLEGLRYKAAALGKCARLLQMIRRRIANNGDTVEAASSEIDR